MDSCCRYAGCVGTAPLLRLGGQCRDEPPGFQELTPEQLETLEKNNKIVTRHLARMGFVQAGKRLSQTNGWFLTAKAYFEAGNPVSVWLSKEQAQAIQIHEPPNKVKISVATFGCCSFVSRVATIRRRSYYRSARQPRC